VKPQLVAEVVFNEWGDDGPRRHPSLLGLREDKKATDVVREEPAAGSDRAGAPVPAALAGHTGVASSRKAAKRSVPRPASPKGKSAPATSRAKSHGASMAASETIAGMTLSNPDKPYFPEAGITKREIAQYYVSVAKHVLPYLRDRPLALVRCPDGWRGQCFYQKHADRSVHASVSRIEVPESGGSATYFSANSAEALAGLVQWGVIELHPWGSRAPRLDRPDRLIFDFDPDDGVGWKALVEAVSALRVLLEELGLTGFLKTTGGKGLHVVVPIRATLDWNAAKGFTRAVADVLVRTFPDRFTATASKAQRKDRIFIDYLRNAEGATAIAPYAVRARANAPVSTPIDWAELDADVRFDHFNVRTVPERLATLRKDPWGGFGTTKQTVTRAAFRRIGFDG
jgi:bifunctional non-homologous end joining protein LigD